MSKTNETTAKILAYLFSVGVFAWRQNTSGIYDAKKGIYRPAAKVGVADILAIIPPHGRLCGIEVKTGHDRLRVEQVGFQQSVQHVGGIALVVKDYDDFITQWDNVQQKKQ